MTWRKNCYKLSCRLFAGGHGLTLDPSLHVPGVAWSSFQRCHLWEEKRRQKSEAWISSQSYLISPTPPRQLEKRRLRRQIIEQTPWPLSIPARNNQQERTKHLKPELHVDSVFLRSAPNRLDISKGGTVWLGLSDQQGVLLHSPHSSKSYTRPCIALEITVVLLGISPIPMAHCPTHMSRNGVSARACIPKKSYNLRPATLTEIHRLGPLLGCGFDRQKSLDHSISGS